MPHGAQSKAQERVLEHLRTAERRKQTSPHPFQSFRDLLELAYTFMIIPRKSSRRTTTQQPIDRQYETSSRYYLEALNDINLNIFRCIALGILEEIMYLKDITCFPSPVNTGQQLQKLSSSIECSNCGTPAPSKLFCSEYCRQFPKAVRYIRSTILDKRVEREDVQEAIGVKLMALTGGGYPENRRRLTPKLRQQIFERDSYKCQVCGAPATEIDHIRGSSADPSNLRAICGKCNRTEPPRTLGWPAPMRQSSTDRCIGKSNCGQRHRLPLLVCDDHEHWNTWQRSIMAERRARVRAIANDGQGHGPVRGIP